jgi:xylulokinase
MVWDFQTNSIAQGLLDYYGIDSSLVPDLVPTFGIQGHLTPEAAEELGLHIGTPVTYRAGDQPNNAFTLKVMEPGQFAATGGNSAVIYGLTGELISDPTSRVNTFAHVNHRQDRARLGILLCMNGLGVMNSWLRQNMSDRLNYDDFSRIACEAPIGSEGLVILPFGNGAERMLGDKNIMAQIHGLGFNNHTQAHLFRSAKEGVAFALNYGLEIMSGLGIKPSRIRACKANMFFSPVFRETLANISGTTIELFNTDGSEGAARASGYGAGIYQNPSEAFSGTCRAEEIPPDPSLSSQYHEAYYHWKKILEDQLRLWH